MTGSNACAKGKMTSRKWAAPCVLARGYATAYAAWRCAVLDGFFDGSEAQLMGSCAREGQAGHGSVNGRGDEGRIDTVLHSHNSIVTLLSILFGAAFTMAALRAPARSCAQNVPTNHSWPSAPFAQSFLIILLTVWRAIGAPFLILA